jgi:hypothetical protein
MQAISIKNSNEKSIQELNKEKQIRKQKKEQ